MVGGLRLAASGHTRSNEGFASCGTGPVVIGLTDSQAHLDIDVDSRFPEFCGQATHRRMLNFAR